MEANITQLYQMYRKPNRIPERLIESEIVVYNNSLISSYNVIKIVVYERIFEYINYRLLRGLEFGVILIT
jgi:hypothetical protein